MSSMFTTKNDKIIVDGYIHEIESKLMINIPQEIIHTIFIWYHLTHEILKFNDKRQTSNCYTLSDDNTCATRDGTKNTCYHSYILPDCKPVFRGKHCWRISVKNPKAKWIGFYVSSVDEFNNQTVL